MKDLVGEIPVCNGCSSLMFTVIVEKGAMVGNGLLRIPCKRFEHSLWIKRYILVLI